MKDRIILITGPKHSGKTSAGQALAAELGAEFFDLDALMESETGKSPRTLYKEGRDVFVKAETVALSNLTGRKGRLVAAAGGGLIDNPEAVDILADRIKSGQVIPVYLEVSAETAWQRIFDAAKKPSGSLPAFLNTANPRETHAEIHCRRAQKYRETARIIIPAENKAPQTLAQEIAEQVLPLL